MTAGIDYSFNPHPSVAAMKDAGVQFVCRYISRDSANDANGKNLIPSECKTLRDAGFKIVMVMEEGSAMMLGGHPAGVSAAGDANAVVKALGMPGMPVYFAADFDATPAQQAPINAFLDGAASVIGRHRTGLYGGYYVVNRAFDAGKCSYGWQTTAWSGGQWDRRDHIRQGLTFSLGSASVEHDTAMFADYGQWPRPAAPPPAGPHKHVTNAGDTVHSIAQARSMDDAAWLALQEKLGGKSAAEALARGPLPAGLTWYSLQP